MADGFDVDPEAIRDMGLHLRESLEPLLEAAGDTPEAEAGLMTLVIERAIASLLQGLSGYASSTSRLGDDMVRSALQYHWADQDSRASFAQLLIPGTSEAEAERLTAEPPGSSWARLEDEQLADLRDLFSPTGPSSGPTAAPGPTDSSDAGGLESLLLGPLEESPPGTTSRGSDDDAP